MWFEKRLHLKKRFCSLQHVSVSLIIVICPWKDQWMINVNFMEIYLISFPAAWSKMRAHDPSTNSSWNTSLSCALGPTPWMLPNLCRGSWTRWQIMAESCTPMIHTTADGAWGIVALCSSPTALKCRVSLFLLPQTTIHVFFQGGWLLFVLRKWMESVHSNSKLGSVLNCIFNKCAWIYFLPNLITNV